MKKRTILIAIGILSALILSWNIYERLTTGINTTTRERKRPRVAVEVQPIQRSEIQDVGVFTGTLKPRSVVLVAPKVSGRLEKLMVDIGDRLHPGQPLVQLDDEEFSHQLRQAAANRDVAKANLEAAKEIMRIVTLDLERTQSLRKKNLVSPAELDTAKNRFTDQTAKYRVATAQLAEKQAFYDAAALRLSYTRINNSWGDPDSTLVIGERFVDEGSLLSPNAPIVSILDISSLVAVVNVTEKDYFKIKLGQPAELTVDAIPGQWFSGKVARISPLIKEKTREALIELEVPNPGGILKPGLFIRTTIRFASFPQAIVVPVSALVKRQEKQGIFLANTDTHTAQFIAIQSGIHYNQAVQVLSPAVSGMVITLGHHLLEDGSDIAIPQLSPKASKSPRETQPN